MSTREKMTILLAVVVLLFGGLHILLNNRADPTNLTKSANQKRIVAFVDQTRNDLAAVSLSETETQALAAAAREWNESPFVERRPTLGKRDDDAPAFKYTGFLKMGKRQFAIVNGQEYRVGDVVAPGSYKVESIKAANVVLRGRTEGDRIIVPVEEEPGK